MESASASQPLCGVCGGRILAQVQLTAFVPVAGTTDSTWSSADVLEWATFEFQPPAGPAHVSAYSCSSCERTALTLDELLRA